MTIAEKNLEYILKEPTWKGYPYPPVRAYEAARAVRAERGWELVNEAIEALERFKTAHPGTFRLKFHEYGMTRISYITDPREGYLRNFPQYRASHHRPDRHPLYRRRWAYEQAVGGAWALLAGKIDANRSLDQKATRARVIALLSNPADYKTQAGMRSVLVWED